MALNDPATALSNRRGFRLRAVSLVATWMILFVFRATARDASTDALWSRSEAWVGQAFPPA